MVSIPAVIDEYNHNMNGCDKIDQMITYYGHFQKKTKVLETYFSLAFGDYSGQFVHYI